MSAPPVLGVYLSPDFDLKAFYGAAFSCFEPEVQVLDPEQITDPNAVRFAVCWQPHADSLTRYVNLGLVSVVGAGVDALLGNPGLRVDLPVCRVRDADQARQMAGYVVHEVLHVERGFGRMEKEAQQQIWNPVPARLPSEVAVTVLGYGSMGAEIVRMLTALGFSVRVATRSLPAQQIDGVRYHAGGTGLLAAVEAADFLVNVLPLTVETRGILNGRIFSQMAMGSWLIQIGRGEHLVEEDLLAALENGRLAGASLDVFANEPLPKDHVFWGDPRLRLTPHIASTASPLTTAAQIVQSVREMRDGMPLSFAVERARGY